MATIPNAGLNALAAQVQTLITYVAVGTGCGTLNGALTAGVAYTSLPLNAGLPAALASGAQLTVTDGTNSETVTVATGGAAQGANVIPINSWTPAHSYAANTTGVCPTPQTTDLQLYNETYRVPANAGSAGANPGESLNAAYFDPTTPTGIYLEVGYFGGSTATATANSGSLVARDLQYWNHTQNVDSASFQLDSTV